MKVVHIITGLGEGGAEGVLYRLCTGESNENTHIVVSLMDHGRYGSLLESAGVELHTLGMGRGRPTFRGLLKLWRLLRSHRPDVVQTWMYHADFIGGLIARLASIRSVCWGVRNSDLQAGKSKRSTILIARACAFLSRLIPARIVCCSVSAVDVHVGLGYQATKFAVIPNGFDLTRFYPNEESRTRLRREFGIDYSSPVIGMVARFDEQKDHATLVSAIGRLKRRGVRLHCVLAGTKMDADNGKLASWLQAEDVADQFILLGRRDDVADIMNAIDIHVLSSAYGEAFPNVLAEAMACGTPCVTTDVGDAGMIVGNTGWVVPRADPELLAQKLFVAIESLGDEAAWASRRKLCRARVAEKFSLEVMVSTYQQLWQEVVAK